MTNRTQTRHRLSTLCADVDSDSYTALVPDVREQPLAQVVPAGDDTAPRALVRQRPMRHVRSRIRTGITEALARGCGTLRSRAAKARNAILRRRVVPSSSDRVTPFLPGQSEGSGPRLIELPGRATVSRHGLALMAILAIWHQPVRASQVATQARAHIMIEEIVTLQGPPGSPQPHERFVPTITQDRGGQYFLAPMADFQSIGVYRQDGNFDRLIRGLNTDAGRFFYVSDVKTRNDTLIVVDDRNLLLLPPQDDGAIQVIPLNYHPEGVLPLPAGGYLTQADIRIPSMIGLPVHVHGADGEHIRSFGRSSDRLSASVPYDFVRTIAYGPNGSFFVASVNRYRIENWSLSGRLLGAIEKAPSWFTPWESMPSDLRAEKPPPWLDSVRFAEEDGVLWCVFHVPDRNWVKTSDTDPTVEAPGGSDLTLDKMHDVFDTIIEVIDLRSGEVVASKRIDQRISGYLNDGKNIYTAVTRDGDIRVTLLRLFLIKS